ncbi:hypothetical protein DESC_780138 [Desulfosarcina cetonica]|nr:hypothetical protein DESC_780138 [Desulfosarcina cetonica]
MVLGAPYQMVNINQPYMMWSYYLSFRIKVLAN